MLKMDNVKELIELDFTYDEIATALNSKPATVRKYVSRNFADLIEKREKEKLAKIEKLYIDGNDSKEIGEKLGLEDSTVRYYISSKFKHLKEKHEENRKERKKIQRECNRILNKEDNNSLSTRSFVMQNIQSYEQQKDGTYVFNQKRSGLATLGVPRKYVFQA